MALLCQRGPKPSARPCFFKNKLKVDLTELIFKRQKAFGIQFQVCQKSMVLICKEMESAGYLDSKPLMQTIEIH